MKPKSFTNTKIIQIMVDKRYRIVRHLAFLIMGGLMLLYPIYYSEDYNLYPYYRSLCIYIILIFAFYVNMYILVPRFFFKNQYLTYLIMLLLLIKVCFYFIAQLLQSGLFDQTQEVIYRYSDKNHGKFEGTINVLCIALLTTMIKLFQRWVRDNEKISELKSIAHTMELEQLRNQINPHFLFNMLNGIKALIRTNPEKATIIIMRLSDFLRYQLYNKSEEKVLLKSEIIFLHNYLELEKTRKDNLLIEIIPSLEDISTLKGTLIPPNLFTTFVENAVKHSVSITGDNSFIKIRIEIHDQKLYFICKNSIDTEYIPSKGINSGLGLSNIKRRLELLYGDNHILEIKHEINVYSVKLTIPI